MSIKMLRPMFFILLLALFVVTSGCKPRKPVIPDLIGLTQAEAEAAIRNAGFQIGTITEDFHDVIFMGRVFWQSPVAGATPPSNTPIDLVISLGAKEDEFIFDVELAPETIYIDEDLLGLLLDEDLENEVYTFDAAGLAAQGVELLENAPLIIHGKTIRRIAALREEAGAIIVETEYCTLNEAIHEGTIAWDYGVAFTPEKIAAIELPGWGKVYPKAGEPIVFDITIGDYNYKITCTLENTHATAEFIVSKSLPGSAGARLEAKGEIQRFRSRNNIVLAGGAPSDFDHQLNGMRGDLTLELIVAASGNDAINFEFPVPVMTIPFVVGFIPVELKIKIQFVINAVVPYDGSSRVKTAFHYDSDLGFSYDGISLSAGGYLGSVGFGDPIHQTGASSAISTNFGVGFPRVELSIARETLVPWAQTAFLIGGSYTFTPACQTADALFLGALGYKLGFLGWNIASGSKTLFREEKELLRSGQCPKSAIPLELFDAETALYNTIMIHPED